MAFLSRWLPRWLRISPFDRAAGLAGDGGEAGVGGEMAAGRESVDVTDLGEDPCAGPGPDSRD
jgi:hypothetical protein